NTVGSTAGWTSGGALTRGGTKDPSRSGPNSLFLGQTEILSPGYLYKAFLPTIDTSTKALGGVRLSVNPRNPHQQFNFYLVDSGFNPYIEFYFGSGGQIFTATNGVCCDIFGTYSPLTWYDVDLKFNPSQQVFSFDVSSNGTPIISASNLAVFDAS